MLHWFVIDDDGHGRLTARNGFRQGRDLRRPRRARAAGERVRPRPTAPSTSWTCTAGSCRTRRTRRSTCRTTSRRTSSPRRSTAGASGASPTRRRGASSKPALSKETPAGLVPYLAHPIGWWRDTAQQLLVQRGDRTGRARAEGPPAHGAGLADEAARAGHARRVGRARRRDASAALSAIRRPTCARGPSDGPSRGWPSRATRSPPRPSAHGRSALDRPPPARGVDRRAAGGGATRARAGDAATLRRAMRSPSTPS